MSKKFVKALIQDVRGRVREWWHREHTKIRCSTAAELGALSIPAAIIFAAYVSAVAATITLIGGPALALCLYNKPGLMRYYRRLRAVSIAR